MTESPRPKTAGRAKRPPKLMIGWREVLLLPDLLAAPLKAKTDTGARTTALHSARIEEFTKDGALWVRFEVDHSSLAAPTQVCAPVLHRRKITNTSGVPEQRYIIITQIQIGARQGPVEISLANRADMGFPLILGRTALRSLRLTVDPARSWLVSERPTPKHLKPAPSERTPS